ncbi:MAG: oligosaccharide flippase family protein [Rubrobacteraceae bacterium]|nr:oligosaccharide flippase family protein [Rubrobacteraceae bacterium]
MIDQRPKAPPRLVMLISFGGTSVLNYGFSLIMGWLLLPGDFGWLAFAQAVILVAGLVLQQGFTWSLARAVANADGPDRDALVRGALVANLVLAITMGSIVAGLFAAGPLRPGLETGAVAAIVALSFLFISLAATARGCAQGSERFGMVAALQVAEILCKVLGGTTLVLLGFGATGAVAGFLLGGLAATALGLYFLVYKLGVRLRGNIELPAIRLAGPMFVALLGLSLLLNLDLIALKLFTEARTPVGYYQAGLVLANAPYYLVTVSFVQVLFVRLARLGDLAATRRAVGETLSMVVTLVLPIEVVFMIVPEQALLALFPDAYASGASALRLLAIGNALLILAAVLSAAFQAVGRARVPALVLLAVVLPESLVLWMIVPARGTTGAASVFATAAAIALIALGMVYLREAGLETFRRVAAWLFRYAAAIGVGAAVGSVTFGLGLGVNPAILVGVACYVASLIFLRLIDPLALLGQRPLLGRPLASNGE